MGRIKKWKISILLAIVVSGCAPSNQDSPKIEYKSEKTEQDSAEMKGIPEEPGQNMTEMEHAAEEILKKGYQLPLEDAVKEEAEMDCIQAMEKLRVVYMKADKGNSLNTILDKENIFEMYTILQETGCPVTAAGFHYIMGNYEKMEAFLADCLNGRESGIILYKINISGGINRSQFLFDGTDLYVIDSVALWSEENTPRIANTTYTRIKDWRYTEKGWFSYEYCVPEYPEVTEVVNGNNLIRVKPMSEEYIRMAEDYLLPIGYRGSNLFRSDWDDRHLENLDYNGLYESLYSLKYKSTFDSKKYSDGIPKEEFENLITEYLPITEEELIQYAVYDEEKQSYGWKRLGPLTYIVNNFSSSIPEVTDIIENSDGTLSVYIDAVCQSQGEDSVMSHIVTLQISDDGSVRYLRNQVLEDGLKNITEYKYRLS